MGIWTLRLLCGCAEVVPNSVVCLKLMVGVGVGVAWIGVRGREWDVYPGYWKSVACGVA
jgi:hypothetical protein